MLLPFLPSSTKNRLIRLGLTVLFLIMVLFFEFLGFNDQLISIGQKSLQPLLQLNVKFASQFLGFAQNIRSWQSNVRLIQDLELKLAQSSVTLNQIDQLQKENQQLRAILNAGDRSLDDRVLATPIVSLAQPAIGVPSAVELSAGSAILIENTLIGVVSEVTNNVAYLSLLWQKDSPYILAQTSTGVKGLLVGDGRAVLLTEIPVEETVEIGQRVMTSGQEGIGAGIYIGDIRSVKSGHSSAVKTAVIEQYVSFYEASFVEVKF